ncbi:TolC family protein [Elusimicrobiota bacterium]
MRVSFYLLIYLLATASLYSGDSIDDQETAQNPQQVSIEEFVKTAVSKDQMFEQILIDEMKLKYLNALNVPAGDLIISAKSQYEFISGNSEYNGADFAVSLEKLFPYTGTELEAGYSSSNLSTSDENSSSLSFLISQSVAGNAFGKVNELLDRITGTETAIAEYQITEAYEDYLAKITTLYYNWYFAYENFKIGELSYEQSLKLLDNMRERRKSKIALPVDVNKINIQTLTKKENLIKLDEKYRSLVNTIKKVLRYNGSRDIVPSAPFNYQDIDIDFNVEYREFINTSRTYRILNLLVQKTGMEADVASDALLPSASLFAGYSGSGTGYALNDIKNTIYGGVSFDWNPKATRDSAKHEIAKIEDRKLRIKNTNKLLELETGIKNLFFEIEREKELIKIAEEKIELVSSILEDEIRNYTYGKVSLNDYIDAVNKLDENRFSSILHNIELKILITEWLRLTDKLISKKDLRK